MKALATLTLGTLLLLGACAKDPKLAIDQALAANDLPKAQALLDAAVVAKPERNDLHALRYVLARHLTVNGPEAGKDAAFKVAIAEYEWLADHYKLPKDYTNRDASLRANAPVAALLEAAGKSLYR